MTNTHGCYAGQRRHAAHRTHRLGALAAVLLLATGCASSPPPTPPSLALARAAVREAQSAGAAQHAPLQLRGAQDKLTRANAAYHDENMAAAARLGEVAEADARLAEAAARNAKAQQAVATLEQGNRTLHQELQRMSPPVPGDSQ